MSISLKLQADGVNDMSVLSEGAGQDIDMIVLALDVYGGGKCNLSFATIVTRGVESPWTHIKRKSIFTAQRSPHCFRTCRISPL